MKRCRLLAVAAACLLGLPALADQPIVIKFSHVVTPDSPKGKAADYFKKIAEERTRGRVKVEVYPNSSLYKDKEELESLQMGAVQMLAPAPAKFGPMGIREYEVFDLPYLFETIPVAQKVTQGPIGQQLLKKLDARGIAGLAFWDNSFRQMTSNRPLRRPEDLKGLKIRIQSSKVTETQMRDVGALPQVMGFGELYQALQSGVVDGQENPASNIYTQKMHEVQKYMALTDHTYHGYVLVANRKFWDGLPADIRQILDGAVKDTTTYFNSIASQENEDALEAIRKSGKMQIAVLTAEEKMAWKKAFTRVHGQMEGKIGKDLIQAIYKETGFDPGKL